MSDHNGGTSDGTFINSIVGEGTRFRGELSLAGLLRIDGDFSGSIKTDGKVIVGRNGRAEATIKAATVVVGGVVRGNIYSTEKVMILSTGIVIGNISTQRLIVEEGVVLDGTCMISRVAAVAEVSAPAPVEAIRAPVLEPASSAAAPASTPHVAASKYGLPLWNR